MVERTRRGEIYTDKELEPWFDEVAKGFSFEQASDNLGYDWKKTQNTFYGDDDVFGHALDLSMIAGAQIRMGKLEVPDRTDGLYEEFRDPANWWPEE